MSTAKPPRVWPMLLPLLMVACTGMAPVSADLEASYGEARSLLEAGRTEESLRAYDAALAVPGAASVEASLRLERAHALLRLGRAEEAAADARIAAGTARDVGAVRDARLVLGTALHDAVRARPGARDAEAEASLRESHEFLREAAGTHPDSAARAFAAARLGEVRESLALLEIARLQDDLATRDITTARERAAYIETEYPGLEAVRGAADLLRQARTL